MAPGEPSQRDLTRLYAVCEDADAALGSLAAELGSGQLRSLVTDALGKLSALQWYAVKRLGGIPDRDDDGDAIDWAELWEMSQERALNGGHQVPENRAI